MIWLFVLWLLALILGLFFVLMAIVSGVIRYTKNQERRQRKKRVNCIKKGQGTIIDLYEDKVKRILLVEVKINKNQKVFTDIIPAQIVPQRFLGIKVSKRYCYPEKIKPGSVVDIKYDPRNPEVGYIVY